MHIVSTVRRKGLVGSSCTAQQGLLVRFVDESISSSMHCVPEVDLLLDICNVVGERVLIVGHVDGASR